MWSPPDADRRRGSWEVVRVVTVAGALYAVFVVLRLAAFGWDPSAFVVAGDGVTDVAEAPADLGVSEGVDGYDGQAYYRLSLEPLTDEIRDHGIAFTRPAYWQTRIGYPSTVWVFSLGGRPALVPAAMVAVNLAALLAMTACAGLLARDLGRSAWLGLVPALWAGYVIGVGQDLTEPLAGALLLVALLALSRGHPLLATIALTAAVLTRETALVLAGAIVVASVVARFPRPPWWVGVTPIVGYAAWRAWVHQRWADVVPDPPSDNPLTVPLVELVRHLGRAAGDPSTHAANLVLLLPTLAVLVLVAFGLGGRGPGTTYLRLALVGYLVLVACLPVWDRSQAYLRWSCEPVLLGWLLLLHRPAVRPRVLPAVAGLVAATWIAAVAATYAYPGPDHWVPADRRIDLP